MVTPGGSHVTASPTVPCATLLAPGTDAAYEYENKPGKVQSAASLSRTGPDPAAAAG